MLGSRTLAILLATLIALGPTTAFAQGFDFGGDEVSTDDTSTDDADADDQKNEIVFGEAEAEAATKQNTGDERPTVAVLAVPSQFVDDSMRTRLEAKMNEVLKDIPENIYVGSDDVLANLQERSFDDVQGCVREKLCMGGAANKANVNKVLVAQVYPSTSGTGKTLTIDFFDVHDNIYQNYSKEENLQTDSEIFDAVKPLINRIFDIRRRKKGEFVGPEDNSVVAPIIAWTSLGLAAGAIATGGYFTYAAKTADDELKEKVQNKNITQRQAFEDNEAVKSKQTLSYIFYGIGGGLAAVSVVFFLLDIGGDVSNDQEEAGIYDLKLSPILGPDTAGLTAGFSF